MLLGAFSVPMSAPGFQERIKAVIAHLAERASPAADTIVRVLSDKARRVTRVWKRLAGAALLFLVLSALGLSGGAAFAGFAIVAAMIMSGGDGTERDDPQGGDLAAGYGSHEDPAATGTTTVGAHSSTRCRTQPLPSISMAMWCTPTRSCSSCSPRRGSGRR